MKWLPENLFEHQFIRPKRAFRDCYNKNCKSGKNRLHIVVTQINGVAYREVLEWCNCCYEKTEDYYIGIPSYLINYNLLLATHYNLRSSEFLKQCQCNEKLLQNTINFYKKLKRDITKDPYFRHLKRVKNRRLLQNKK